MRGMMLILGSIVAAPWLILAFAHPGHDHEELPLAGAWTAVSSLRNGQPAGDVVGNRLLIKGDRFEIHSPKGDLMFSGAVKTDTSVTPAGIDFLHAHGGLEGKVWKGIYVLENGRLTVCDNAPNVEASRPTAFSAPAGSGYVLVTFTRNGKPDEANPNQ
jgi:uncharacterized protein (TIGR03067 family)